MVWHHDDTGLLVTRVDQQLVEKFVVSSEDQPVGPDDLSSLAENDAVREGFLLPEIFHVRLLRQRLTRLELTLRSFSTDEMICTWIT